MAILYSNKSITDGCTTYKLVVIERVSVIVFGLATIGLSFLASVFSSVLVQATSTIWGVLGGPLAGIFIMGFFIPFANSAVSQQYVSML